MAQPGNIYMVSVFQPEGMKIIYFELVDLMTLLRKLSPLQTEYYRRLRGETRGKFEMFGQYKCIKTKKN